MAESYDRIARVAVSLFNIAKELEPIDLELSSEYLIQAQDFMSIIPEDKAYFPEEEKNQFKQLLMT